MIDWLAGPGIDDSPELLRWIEQLTETARATRNASVHGDLPRWLAALEQLPDIAVDPIDLNCAAVTAKTNIDLPDSTINQLKTALMGLHPWRKGPFDIAGVLIDSEWRSDLKWQRVQSAMPDLSGQRVLDVGCGNGYYCMRMAGAGARTVVGIDPLPLFCLQYRAINRYIGLSNCTVLPVGAESLQAHSYPFDTVFSMGVLYHRRDHNEHLKTLAGCLRALGTLCLETLVIPGDDDNYLIPEGRYAGMRNVWALPTVNTLRQWVLGAGFSDVRCIDITQTDSEEQRPTEWMKFHSLRQTLDAHDPSKTIEGHPAPRRAILMATKNA